MFTAEIVISVPVPGAGVWAVDGVMREDGFSAARYVGGQVAVDGGAPGGGHPHHSGEVVSPILVGWHDSSLFPGRSDRIGSHPDLDAPAIPGLHTQG